MQLFMHTARLTCYEKSSILFLKGSVKKIILFRSSYGKRFPVCGISQRIYNIKEEM